MVDASATAMGLSLPRADVTSLRKPVNHSGSRRPRPRAAATRSVRCGRRRRAWAPVLWHRRGREALFTGPLRHLRQCLHRGRRVADEPGDEGRQLALQPGDLLLDGERLAEAGAGAGLAQPAYVE